ncbi:MAG TPA: glycosyltransferase [Bellilinea sp.]|nr:glycosyltransferase [Bellilinea sp.]
MTRILYFSRSYTPHDHRFLSALAGTPHAVAFLQLEPAQRTTEMRRVPDGIEVIPWLGGQKAFHWRDVPALSADLQRVIDAYQPDVIHAGPVQSAAYITAKSSFEPLLTMSWGSDLLLEADNNAWMQRVTRYTLKHSTVLAGDCLAVQQKAADFGFPAERVVLFPWGVDLERFTPDRNTTLRAQLGWQNAFVVLSLRSWEPLYGVDELVSGFALAAQQTPDMRLLLLSGGSQAEVLHGILAQHNLHDRVHFAGQIGQQELPAYYQAADLYVSASHSDGSSVSLMEALACGLPSLVSDIPANREWLADSPAGWLFPDGDVQAIAAGILQAYTRRKTLQPMQSAARALAQKRANWPENFKKLLSAYELAQQLVRSPQKVVA